MLIQAALNGDRIRTDHAALPVSVEDLARDAVACVAAGAGAVHLHPRNADGMETLDAAIADAVVQRVRDACGVPVGVTTGAWIEPDLDRRVALVRAWRAPDYASVNLSEDGAEAVMRALLDAGVGIEAGIASVLDVERLAASGLARRVARILVEPYGDDPANVLPLIEGIHAVLDCHGIVASRLQHSDGVATWPVLADAIRRGLDIRVGLEDTLLDPEGSVTEDNASLIRAAVSIAAEGQPSA